MPKASRAILLQQKTASPLLDTTNNGDAVFIDE